MVAGVRLVLRRPVLRGSLATDLFATILAMPISLFPLVNEVRFGGSASTLGFFLSAVAVGGIGAGLLSGTVTRARRAGLVQLAAAGSWAEVMRAPGVSVCVPTIIDPNTGGSEAGRAAAGVGRC